MAENHDQNLEDLEELEDIRIFDEAISKNEPRYRWAEVKAELGLD